LIETTLVSSECQSIIEPFPQSQYFELPSFFDDELTKKNIKRDIIKIALSAHSRLEETQSITSVSSNVLARSLGLQEAFVLKVYKELLSKRFTWADDGFQYRRLLFDRGGGGVSAVRAFFISGYLGSMSLSQKMVWLLTLKRSCALKHVLYHAPLYADNFVSIESISKIISDEKVFARDTLRKSFKWLVNNGFLIEIEKMYADSEIEPRFRSGFLLIMRPELKKGTDAYRKLKMLQYSREKTRKKNESRHIFTRELKRRKLEREVPIAVKDSSYSSLRATNTTSKMPRLEVLKDTREKQGYSFRDYDDVHIKWATLDVGDYQILGSPYAIERKSLIDLYQTLSDERISTFVNEFQRAKAQGIRLRVVIEAQEAEVQDWYKNIIHLLEKQYHIEFVYAGDKTGAERETIRWLGNNAIQ